MRIIPTILCRGRTLVKGQKFNSWRSVGVAAQAVRIHAARMVDEICLLDIGATREGRGPDLDLVRELSDVLFCPLAVGGGVKSVEDVKNLLRAGADKVVIGTAALEYRDRPTLIQDISAAVGSQAIVVAIDVNYDGDGVKRAWFGCGVTCTHYTPEELAQDAMRRGAGEILLTSIDREGTMEGYDLELIRAVSQAVAVPVIAHGGCRDYDDMVSAIQCGASAVAAGALFQFTDATPRGAAQYLAKKGIEVRL